MPADLDVGIVASKGQLQRVFVPADRAYRVPDADKPRLSNPCRKRALEVGGKIEIALLLGASIPTPAVDCVCPHQQADGIGYERIITARNESVHTQERCHRARRIRAAAEPEQEDAIAFAEVAHQKNVGIANVALEPIAEGSARKSREKAVAPDRAPGGSIVPSPGW